MVSGIYNHKQTKTSIYTKERNKKISDKLRGRPTWILGKHHTEETRRKMSISAMGKKMSEESRKKMSLSQKKRKFKKGYKCPRGSLAKREEKNPSWKGGISKIQFLKYKEKIAGRKKPEQCEICGAMGIICFDHDHETGKFRGWICKRCNTVLGFIKDNKELLFAMIEYLKHSRKSA
mgnify:CR=1 FL=1